MDGPTHRKIAPIFTLGATYLTVTARGLDPTTAMSVIALSSALSIRSANWPDADLAAMQKPVPAIWAGTFIGTLAGVRKTRIKNSKGRIQTVYIYKKKKYTRTKGFSIKIWATFFRLVGVRGHRVWQSHSPVVWVPIVYISYASYLVKFGDSTMLTALFSAIPLGYGYGFLSHLFGDALTYSGLPLLPEFKRMWKIPILGWFIRLINKLFSNLRLAKFSFAKATSKGWNKAVYMSIIFIVIAIIFPAQTKEILLMIWNMIFNLVKTIWMK